MFDFFRLKSVEWLSLALIAVVLTVSIAALQNSSKGVVSIQGKPAFERSIAQKGSLKNPLAVAVYKDKIMATSSADGQIKIFSPNGNEIATAQLDADSYPTSLALKRDGTLFIGAKRNIYKGSVSLNLKNIEKVKVKGSIQPLAIATHNDNLLVFDGISQKLKILNAGKEKLENFTDKKVVLSYVNGVYSDGETVYVADSNGRRIVRLTSDGKYKASLKNFSLPRGIAVDSLKRLHVVDTFANTVKVYDKDGTFIYNYGEEGKGEGNLYLPNGLAVDSKNGKIYVVDKGNNRLQVWSW